jgi:hypothetical protein
MSECQQEILESAANFYYVKICFIFIILMNTELLL